MCHPLSMCTTQAVHYLFCTFIWYDLAFSNLINILSAKCSKWNPLTFKMAFRSKKWFKTITSLWWYLCTCKMKSSPCSLSLATKLPYFRQPSWMNRTWFRSTSRISESGTASSRHDHTCIIFGSCPPLLRRLSWAAAAAFFCRALRGLGGDILIISLVDELAHLKVTGSLIKKYEM